MSIKHIFLYVLDSLRADHLSCYGYKKNTTPNIDNLAADGVMFKNSFTPSTWTRPVAASLLTGLYPEVIKLQTRFDMFPSFVNSLPEILQKEGFKTSAFTAMGNVSSETGFDKGFDNFINLYNEPSICALRDKSNALSYKNKREVTMPTAEDINRFIFPWLEDYVACNSFSFIWAIDTHSPFILPNNDDKKRPSVKRGEGYKYSQKNKELIVEQYDKVISYADDCIGLLVQKLKNLKIYEDSMIIITSDHGEAFNEHGFFSHGNIPYDELINVPLIIKFPDYIRIRRGENISELVQLIDLFSTILSVADIKYNTKYIQSKDLLLLIEGKVKALHRYVYSETQSLPFLKKHFSVRSQYWKYMYSKSPKWTFKNFFLLMQYIIQHRLWSKFLVNPFFLLNRHISCRSEQLYFLKRDKKEINNIVNHEKDIAMQFRNQLSIWREANKNLSKDLNIQQIQLDESKTLQNHLESLGYL